MWFIWLYARKVIGMRPLYAAPSATSFLLATYLAVPYADVLHGAPVYTPGLAVVSVLGIYHAIKQQASRLALILTAGVYFAALFFRTIDQEVCNSVPAGTHFIWHSLIGLVTYLAMRALILSYRSGSGAARGGLD